MKSICDLHTHSAISNHAFSTLSENIRQAYSIGLKYYGISEHQPDNYGIGADSVEINAMNHVPNNYQGMVILKGTEFNILPGGIVDPMGINLKRLNYGIASMHSFAYKPEEHNMDENTNAYLKALDYDFVDIIGHIDDGHFPCDFEKIVKKCKEKHKIIEVNDSSFTLNTYRINSRENIKEALKQCIKYDVPVIINSDAHICFNIGNNKDAIKILEEINFPMDRVLNFNEDLFKEYFINKEI